MGRRCEPVERRGVDAKVIKDTKKSGQRKKM